MKDKLLIELVVVLALVGFGLWSLYKEPLNMTYVVPEEGVLDTTSGGNGNAVVPVANITYAQALVRYKDARIQLGQDCQASPTDVTYKNGREVMIDNRSDKVRTVKLGAVFSVKAWGFKIVKLSSATLPATWFVDCDKSQNVATVLIQK